MARLIKEHVVILNPALYNPAPPQTTPTGVPAQPLAPALGLGDIVERYAHPIAVRIDRVTAKLPPKLRTRLAWCSACSRRRVRFNGWVADIRSWAAWRHAIGRFMAFLSAPLGML